MTPEEFVELRVNALVEYAGEDAADDDEGLWLRLPGPRRVIGKLLPDLVCVEGPSVPPMWITADKIKLAEY